MPFLSPLPLVAIFLTWLAVRYTPARQARHAIVLLASGIFYYSVGGSFIVILALSIVFNFYWGDLLRRTSSTPLLFTGIAVNIGLLSTFKYLPQLAQPWANLSPTAAQIAALVLPVGISFWTFQGLSYLFDQYRGEELDPTLLEFAIYIAFAPTVLSGPISRLSELLPQLRSSERAGWSDLARGTQQMWVGIWMISLGRLLGSGVPAEGVTWAFDRSAGLGFFEVWLLLIGYGFQIFFDFAGYSRLVIGLAAGFAIQLQENFDRPFLSLTPTTFWQRWHMSLSFWIRDYLFMPLAMVRGDLWWRNGVLVLSMAVFGLWHQASWLFLLWGVYQGTLLVLHRFWQQFAKRRKLVVPDLLSWLLTYVVISLGWILFRSQDLPQARALLGAALNPWARATVSLPASFVWLVLLTAAGYFSWCWLSERLEGRSSLNWIPVEGRFSFYALTSYLVVFYRSSVESFIYFRF